MSNRTLHYAIAAECHANCDDPMCPYIHERFEPSQRPLWQPDEQAQLWAIETLLASSIPSELRKAMREREAEMARRTS